MEEKSVDGEIAVVEVFWDVIGEWETEQYKLEEANSQIRVVERDKVNPETIVSMTVRLGRICKRA